MCNNSTERTCSSPSPLRSIYTYTRKRKIVFLLLSSEGVKIKYREKKKNRTKYVYNMICILRMVFFFFQLYSLLSCICKLLKEAEDTRTLTAEGGVYIAQGVWLTWGVGCNTRNVRTGLLKKIRNGFLVWVKNRELKEAPIVCVFFFYVLRMHVE